VGWGPKEHLSAESQGEWWREGKSRWDPLHRSWQNSRSPSCGYQGSWLRELIGLLKGSQELREVTVESCYPEDWMVAHTTPLMTAWKWLNLPGTSGSHSSNCGAQRTEGLVQAWVSVSQCWSVPESPKARDLQSYSWAHPQGLLFWRAGVKPKELHFI
jgi:hypothetical protein